MGAEQRFKDFSSLTAFRRTVYSVDLTKFLHYIVTVQLDCVTFSVCVCVFERFL